MDAWYLPELQADFLRGDLPTPVAGAGEVRIRLKARALNHLDLWLRSGRPTPPSFPHIPGADGAGYIEETGEGVDGWRAGDEVVIDPGMVDSPPGDWPENDSALARDFRILGEHAWGTLAQYVVVPASSVHRRPACLDWAEASSFALVSVTAWRMLRRAGVTPASTVLVVGAGGGVASAAIALAAHRGARVLATSRSPEKRRKAEQLGAIETYTTGEAPAGVADIVIDSSGAPTWEGSIKALRKGGKLAVCGATGGQTVELHLPRLFYKQLTIIGSTMGSRRDMTDVLAMVEEGFRVPVDSEWAFDDLPDALRRLDSAEQAGKVVITGP